MVWLAVTRGKKKEVLSTLEIADTFKLRIKGLIYRSGFSGALFIKPAYWGVHTFGVKLAIDVAYLDSQMVVLKTQTLKPFRLGIMFKCRAVVEAPAGSFELWGLRLGDQLEVDC